MKRSILVKLLFIGVSLCFFIPKSFAGDRWITGTASLSLTQIIRDDIRDRVYLIDNSYLYVINTGSEVVINKIAITGPVSSMAPNKNFSLLDIAGGGQVTRVDLNNLKVISHYSLPGLSITSVAFDYENNVYVWAYPLYEGSPQWGWVYKLNSTGTQILKQFGAGTGLNQQIYNGLLKTDVTGTNLYVGQKGESPLTISKFSILDSSVANTPIFIASNPFNSLGSNLEDFAISPGKYDQIYVAAGAPYGIQVVNATTLTFMTLLNTEAYPSGVALNLSGDSLYGISEPYSNNLYEFNAVNLTLNSNYALQSLANVGEARDITIGRYGLKAFIIDGNPNGKNEVEVVDVQSTVCKLYE